MVVPKPEVVEEDFEETEEIVPGMQSYKAPPEAVDLHLLPKPGQCKWPSGNNPIQFLCAETPLSGCPYCKEHRGLSVGFRR